jgi:hypothetical protein
LLLTVATQRQKGRTFSLLAKAKVAQRILCFWLMQRKGKRSKGGKKAKRGIIQSNIIPDPQ